jgi:hypothetical protein
VRTHICVHLWELVIDGVMYGRVLGTNAAPTALHGEQPISCHTGMIIIAPGHRPRRKARVWH